jgi:hypothetical protein
MKKIFRKGDTLMKKNEKKKTNKKLLSAFGMFMLSGAMLGTATYAWFTMSREVEVHNIQMTATTPEDIQISLGKLSNGGAYVNETGTIQYTGSDGKATPANVTAPGSGTDDQSLAEWTNTIDITKYYTIGKLIPASTNDPANVYFTPDAAGVGRTLKGSAKSYIAASGTTAKIDAGSGTYNATLHIGSGTTPPSSGSWSGYTTATAWNNTHDDGYYVDIPVWCRTSSTEGAILHCEAVVSMYSNPAQGSGTSDDLYMAARVAIIANNSAAAPTDGLVTNTILDINSGTTFPGNGSVVDTGNYYSRWTGSSGTNMGLTTGDASGIEISSGTYGTYTVSSGSTPNGVVKLAPGTGTQYGAATPFVVRVWIDGEDINCWNPNAGQDFNINLKFTNVK